MSSAVDQSVSPSSSARNSPPAIPTARCQPEQHAVRHRSHWPIASPLSIVDRRKSRYHALEADSLSTAARPLNPQPNQWPNCDQEKKRIFFNEAVDNVAPMLLFQSSLRGTTCSAALGGQHSQERSTALGRVHPAGEVVVSISAFYRAVLVVFVAELLFDK